MVHTSKIAEIIKSGWTRIGDRWIHRTAAQQCGLPTCSIIVRSNPNRWQSPKVAPLLAAFESGPLTSLGDGLGGTRFEAASALILAAMAAQAKADAA